MQGLQDMWLGEDGRLALFEEQAETLDDVRGYVVFDRSHRKLGIVSEVFFSSDDLKPRYLEIASFEGKDEVTYMYPIDYARWHRGGPVFLESSAKALREHEEYTPDHVHAVEGNSLLTYGEVLEIWYESDDQLFA